MKTKPLKLAVLAMLPPAMLALSSCTNYGGNEQTTVIAGSNGAAVVDTYTNSATVTGINSSSRTLSLKLENGTRTTVKCGKDVVNFGQIKVNDVVKVTLIDELAVYMGTATVSNIGLMRWHRSWRDGLGPGSRSAWYPDDFSTSE